MDNQNIFDIFEKYSGSDTEEYIQYSKKNDTYRNTCINTTQNTDIKIKNILNQINYSDKESLQDMLDETIKLLHKQETENDKLIIRCREFLKVIEQKHNKIIELEDKNSILEKRNQELEQLFKKNFFSKYI